VKELDDLLAAHVSARRNGELCLLATLVKVEGSSYRQAGARMLLTQGGGRTGGMSGGCLEGEIQKKAWWLTERGPVLQKYQTSGEDGLSAPFGLGCNGTLHVLLKRVEEEDAARMDRLGELRTSRTYAAMATVLSGAGLGMQRLFPGDCGAGILAGDEIEGALKRVAGQEASEYLRLGETEVFVEALPPRPRIVIFGAGDDARPLVQFARLLGWDVTVADARSHLATPARFPLATGVVAAPLEELLLQCGLRDDDVVVVMTHSFEQDHALLGALLARPLRYLGQLGPRQRTQQLLAAILTEPARVHGAAQLHSPIGLDLGGHTPETIALAIIAEIQAVLSKRDAETVAKRKESGVVGILA
jgi:xanthine dehydrogenase accessory factor